MQLYKQQQQVELMQRQEHQSKLELHGSTTAAGVSAVTVFGSTAGESKLDSDQYAAACVRSSISSIWIITGIVFTVQLHP
jgi:hypothetical protein